MYGGVGFVVGHMTQAGAMPSFVTPAFVHLQEFYTPPSYR